jgi:kynurenine formamidase
VFADARRGALGLLGRDEALAGLACARTGEVHRLDLDLAVIDPPLFGRSRLEHTVHGEPGGGSHDDELTFNTQSATQWDGFRHIGHPDHGHFGGLDDEAHGIDAMAGGIVGRGVVLDVGTALERAGRPIRVDAPTPIDPADLELALEATGTELRRGDVLCVRTGWLTWYRGLDAAGRRACAETLGCCGLRPSDELFAFLWDHHVAAVSTDTPALEPWPIGAHLDKAARRSLRDAGRVDLVFGHFAILALLGIPIGELFDLDTWAAAAGRDGRCDALFVSAPLIVTGGVASPPNALAIR